MAIRVAGNTLSLSAEASMCCRPRLGRRENENARGGGGGGTSASEGLLFFLFLFFSDFFDQLSILSRVVNSTS